MSTPNSAADDPFDLARFLRAQEEHYATALAELRRGRKATHWMWFIFPQFAGLGESAISRRFAIQSLEEARAYLAHPVLGGRLVTCMQTLLDGDSRSARAVLGFPDDLKLRSCATLFELVADPESVFARVLEEFFGGDRDAETVRLVGAVGVRAHSTAIDVIALDLEGTLISNVVSQFPRAGLFEFLETCRELAPRVELYTTVPERVARPVLERLCDEGTAPAWFAGIPLVSWTGDVKDLRFVIGVDASRVVLVDDMPIVVHPAQRGQYIEVAGFAPPFTQDDGELLRVAALLRSRHPS